MAKPFLYLVALAFLCISTETFSQKDSTKLRLPHQMKPDTIENATIGEESSAIQKPNKRSPKKAALLSTVCPGAGQIYNKKYWKLPIVYGALGTAGFFYFNNRYWYKEYSDAYINDLDSANAPSIYLLQGIGTGQLRSAADQNQKLMEYSMLAFVLLYGLQIVDATVDAHLFYFDVSDDLSMNLQPTIQIARNQHFVHGLSLNFTF